MTRAALVVITALGLLALAACMGGGEEPALPPDEALLASEDSLAAINSVMLNMESSYEFQGKKEIIYYEIGYEEDEIMFTRYGLEGGNPEFTEELFIPDDYYLRVANGDWFVISPWPRGGPNSEVVSGSVDEVGQYYREIIHMLVDTVQIEDGLIGSEVFYRYEAAIGIPPSGPGFISIEPVRVGEEDGIATVWLYKDTYLPRRVEMTGVVEDSIFNMTVDYIDYDLPVLLPDPPAEAAPYRDYNLHTAGACAGEAIAACLPAQHELDAVSQRFCEGEGRRVCIVPMGQVDAQLVVSLVDYYEERYGLPITIIEPAEVPEEIVNEQRGQVPVDDLIFRMQLRVGDSFQDPDIVLIGLTPLDLYNPFHYWAWIFGIQLTAENPVAVISTFRMNPEIYGQPANEEAFRTRVRKMVSKYIGVLYYELPESSDPLSPVYGSIGGLGDLDNMSEAPLVPVGQ